MSFHCSEIYVSHCGSCIISKIENKSPTSQNRKELRMTQPLIMELKAALYVDNMSKVGLWIRMGQTSFPTMISLSRLNTEEGQH